jgi:uncharacterized protein YkwD
MTLQPERVRADAHVMRRLIALSAAALLLAATPAAAAKRCSSTDLIPTPENTAKVTSATLCLLNKERKLRGRKPLRHNAVLRRAATQYARKMVRQDFFNHVEPDGDTFVDRIKRTTYLDTARWWALGENLGWGTGAGATPAQTVRTWMGSWTHKRNIIAKKYSEIGIGIAIGAPVDGGPQGSATYATSFGKRK